MMYGFIRWVKMSKRKIKIKVTEEHIKNAHKTDIIQCPIALALKEKLPEYKMIIVGCRRVLLFRGFNGEHAIGTVTHTMRNFIREFDNGNPVSPSHYTIEINEESKDE